jgi:murein DD-endopeptidase MepM/ murein hydrolase activator NlpD
MLLPEKDYWSWVRASRDYVMHFGLNLTPEPETAARYFSPRQVVSFPNAAGAYSAADDLKEWFETRFPEVRIDPIKASAPGELQERLAERIEAGDRLGQRQKPFYLLWPSDYPVITQPFGANPQIYGRWDLPGHEGLDIRALPNTNIYCSADGVVYQVQKNANVHAYGIHIRVRHEGGYRTVYGHMAKASVARGDKVSAGQILGKADSTGASTASHLHFTLKKDLSTETRETNYPKDIIDPTPFMVWPEVAKKSIEIEEPKSACLIGAHGRVGESLHEHDYQSIQDARLECLKTEQNESEESLKRLQRIAPDLLLMVQITTDFSKESISPSRFIAEVQENTARLYGLGVRHFELHRNPNLQSEGWMRSWANGSEFGDWYTQVLKALRAAFPAAQFGFPGLSPGDSVTGKRAEAMLFLEQSEGSVLQADWIGVNCYWSDVHGLSSLQEGRLYEEYLLLFAGKPLMVSEFANPSPSLKDSIRARQYLDFWRSLRNRDEIRAAFSFALSSAEGYGNFVWRKEGKSNSTVAQEIGKRSF